MNLQIIKPSPALRPYVKYYWALDNCVHPQKAHAHRIVPTGLPEMTFYFQDIPSYARKSGETKSVSVMNGQQDQFYEVVISGRLSMLSIIFQAWAFKPVFGLPAGEIFNLNLPLIDLLKKGPDEISAKLAAAENLEKRKRVVEEFLLKRLSQKKEYEFKRICSSIALINQSRGSARIESLADCACLSRKQYERTFSDFVGISPKKFLKIVRFQHVLHQSGLHPAKSLTELSYDCGYYDQAHMINDFKQLSGMTPRQYLKECTPESDYFS